MEQQAFIELVEEILEVKPGTVSLENSLDELDWDSLANITFIAEIDTKLNLSLDADRLANSESVADLYELIAASK